MRETYEIPVEVHDEEMMVELTRPTGLDDIFWNPEVPECIENGSRPETPAELEACQELFAALIEHVSDLPSSAIHSVPSGELVRLASACANVYAGNGPSLDEYNTRAYTEAEQNDSGTIDYSNTVDDGVEDAPALAMNSYPHFTDVGEIADDRTGDSETTDYSNETEDDGSNHHVVARGE